MNQVLNIRIQHIIFIKYYFRHICFCQMLVQLRIPKSLNFLEFCIFSGIQSKFKHDIHLHPKYSLYTYPEYSFNCSIMLRHSMMPVMLQNAIKYLWISIFSTVNTAYRYNTTEYYTSNIDKYRFFKNPSLIQKSVQVKCGPL